MGKEKVKLSLFADDLKMLPENYRTHNEFGKPAGYKINTQKSLAFLYTNNEICKKEINETILLVTATKRIKYLGINLTKEAKDLYSEN